MRKNHSTHWRVRSGFYKDLFCLVLLVGITLYFTGVFLRSYLQSEIIGGWDGTNHYAISKFYSRHIFPMPYGWTSNWNAGMPWPLGYPPLFHYLIAVLDSLLPVGFLDLFQGFFALGVFVLPCLIYAICRRLAYTRSMSLFSGIATVFLLRIPHTVVGGTAGLTLNSTFKIGLYPHFFGGLMLFAWLFAFLKVEERRLSRFFSVLLLSLTLLANSHAAQAALLIFLGVAVVRIARERRLATLGLYVTHLFLSLLLISFWALPLMMTYDYFPTKTFPPLPLEKFVQSPWLLTGALLTAVGGWLGIPVRGGRISSLALSAMMIVAVAIVPIKNYFPGLPLQPWRLLPVGYLLMIVVAPFTLTRLVRFTRGGALSERIVLAGVLLPLFFLFKPAEKTLSLPFIADDERGLLEYSQGLTNGRSMVEVYAPGYPLHYNITALLGAEGKHETIWNVFRESGINAPFVAPLRNAFSNRHEDFGVVTMLGGPAGDAFYRQPLLTHLKRARLYNLNYFIIRHKRLARLFLKSGTARLRKAFGKWFVFEATESSPAAETLRFEPAVVFTRLNSKSRPYDGMDAYDWLRLSEEWFYRADFDTVLALAREPYLDTSRDLDHFKTAVVVDCRYGDLGKAEERLERYLAGGGVIVFLVSPGRVDPLAERLKGSRHASRVVLIRKSGDVRRDMAKLLAVFGKFRQPIEDPAEIKDINIGRGRVTMTTSGGEGNASWIYLKNSFFPLWRDRRGGEVYMASPAMTLVLTDGPAVDLVFELGCYFWIGLLLSLTSLGAVVGGYIRSGRKRDVSTLNRTAYHPTA